MIAFKVVANISGKLYSASTSQYEVEYLPNKITLPHSELVGSCLFAFSDLICARTFVNRVFRGHQIWRCNVEKCSTSVSALNSWYSFAECWQSSWNKFNVPNSEVSIIGDNNWPAGTILCKSVMLEERIC